VLNDQAVAQNGGSTRVFSDLLHHWAWCPFRRDRRGATGLEVVLGEVPVDVAGEQRGRGRKISGTKRPPYAADEDIAPGCGDA